MGDELRTGERRHFSLKRRVAFTERGLDGLQLGVGGRVGQTDANHLVHRRRGASVHRDPAAEALHHDMEIGPGGEKMLPDRGGQPCLGRLDTHGQRCRRKHLVTSQRTCSLTSCVRVSPPLDYRPRLLMLKLVAIVSIAATLVALPQGPAKNVVLLLADAGGIPVINAASLHGYGAPRRLFVQRMPNIGLSDTTPTDSWVSDSAAGMTAIVTGHKTKNGVIAQSPEAQRKVADGAPLKTIL